MITKAQKVRVMINPKSGLGASMSNLMQTFTEVWDCDGREVTYQLTKSAEDGKKKARLAIEEGIQTLIVVGGDGVINSIGAELLDAPIGLGVVPTGSGNGFARHFGIDLNPAKAIKQLVHAKPEAIDVGIANGRPFFVTCSMAWDAALVKTFEKSPVRGILPYVFAAAYELFDYKSERFHVSIDNKDEVLYDQPMLFTVANLTQFGGGARIAPKAKADDGFLWLTTAFRDDVPRLIPSLLKLFDGSIGDVPEIKIIPLHEMRVRRETNQPIQLDGELVDSPPEVHIQLRPKALNVLVPTPTDKAEKAEKAEKADKAEKD